MKDLKAAAKYLQQARQRTHMTQLDVALDTDYSVEMISTFECGRVRSLHLFTYYCRTFLTDTEIINLIRGEF